MTAISRRALLGGAGVALAIPLLEGVMPRRSARAGGMTPARRMVCWFVPNGINGSTAAAWRPTATGAGFALSPMLMPLGDLRGECLVLSGVVNHPAQADFGGANDGAGDHARGTGSLLTCARLRKTEGRDIVNGVSIDQVVANAVGMTTRFPSMQLGIDGGSDAGGCDSGYSCAYARNVSWSSPSTPLPKLTSPVTVFDRMFAGGETAAQAARRRVYQTSVLDYVRDEATRLSSRVGATDRAKLDEFLTSVREVERQVGAGATATCPAPMRPAEGMSYPDTVAAMTELTALALRCDLTRVVTFMLGNAGSDRTYPFLGISDGHHTISHHMDDPAKLAKLQQIGTWEVTQFAALLRRLRELREADGSTLLDHTVAFFSSDIHDGNAHDHGDMPVLLGGRCGASFDTGRHVAFATPQPLANLHLTMARAMGVRLDRFGAEGTALTPNLGPVSAG